MAHTNKSYTQEQQDFLLDNWDTCTASQLAIMFNNLFDRQLTEGAIHQFFMRKGLKKNPYTYASDYTEEMAEWIKTNYNKYPNVEAVTNAFNNHFNVHVSKSALWHKAYRLLGCKQVRKSKSKVIQNKWSDEMIEYLKNNLDAQSYPTLAKNINYTFGSNLSASGVEHKANRMGFKKANPYQQYNGRQTWFNKGTISWNKKPLGYERVDKQSNIIWIKVKNPDVFIQKHRLLYMMYHNLEEIPKGINIVFKNGNKRDFREENLIYMSDAELAVFNSTRINPVGNDEIAQIKLDLLQIKLLMKEVNKQ